MYTFSELRVRLKEALDRARISPVKILRRKEIFYIVSEEHYKRMVLDIVKRSINNPKLDDEPRYTETEPYA